MSLSSTKETYREQAAAEIKVFILSFKPDPPKEEDIESYVNEYVSNITHAIFDNVYDWIKANEKEVKTQVVGGSSAGVHGEVSAAKSGLEID